MKKIPMKKTKINALAFALLLVFSLGTAYADTEDFTEAKKLIDAKTLRNQLTESQLEIMGDYLMEQLHPGEAHEAMDRMMGGEGSESLKLMHIAMAKRLYCNDFSGMADYGFGGMMSLGKIGMMGCNGQANQYGGMMNMAMYNMVGYGMMGNFGYGYWSFLTTLLVVGLVILVYLWILKLWKEVFGKKR